eukprot:TRINITY_DN7624_c0_g1_i3.p1 TRINITY_DN7624_c0_g1~~TRINITY_DN7624_c0_g1_i3.p1  ORF type:complete len:327 (-),score=72.00 TRINITY_DN7624_c0_g1_i3:19-999(-)
MLIKSMLRPLLLQTKSKSKDVANIVRCSSSGCLDLTGVYPPICTPFNKDQSIAWHKLDHNMKRWNIEDLAGYLVEGSNGEYCYLSKDERIELVGAVKSHASSDKLVLAGSGCESTLHTIEMTNLMAQAGADAAVVITPCYFKNKMSSAALEKHFLAVADASTIPVILYSVPANTGIDLAVDVVIQLAKHPNIVGIKDSGGDITKLGSLVHGTKDQDFQVLAGSASFLLPALVVGAVGGICALANVLPAQVCELQKLFSESRLEEARLLQHALIAPNSAVTKQLGVPGLKLSLDWFGLYGGPCRSPLLPLTDHEENQLNKAFETFRK